MTKNRAAPADRPDDSAIASAVGLTALLVTAARAIESTGAHPLAVDLFAGEFVRAAQPPTPMPTTAQEATDPLWDYLTTYVALRTRALDDALLEAPLEQVVILGSGLDSRAYRLPWPPDCHLFELDQPAVVTFKQHVLDELDAQPTCVRHAIPEDLDADTWTPSLLDAGLDPAKPTAWLIEGLLPYLSAHGEENLFTHLHTLSAPGSRIVLERPSPRGAHHTRQRSAFNEATERFGVTRRALWKPEPRRDCVTWLRHVGWDVDDHPVHTLQQRYGRTLHTEIRDHLGHNRITTATRRSS